MCIIVLSSTTSFQVYVLLDINRTSKSVSNTAQNLEVFKRYSLINITYLGFMEA